MRDEDSLDPPELAKRRYALRTAVLRGRVRLTPAAGAQLIGPDCAFHLYRQVGVARPDPDEPLPDAPR